MGKTVGRILREIRSLFIIILIALSLRATVIEAYIVPTGSMENTIMTGDFLIGNKFVYGMRTPDWIGVPYTELGFEVPWVRFPEFKKPRQGDVVVFKYPRDPFQKYVKRCIAEPGQVVQVKEKQVLVDGQELSLPLNGKFKHQQVLSSEETRFEEVMFLRKGGNRDNLGPIRVPLKGDVIRIHGDTDWDYLLPVMIMDGHKVTLENERLHRKFEFTMKDPNDIARRYLSGLGVRLKRLFSKAPHRPRKLERMYKEYYSQNNPDGNLLNVWNFKFTNDVVSFLRIDGKRVKDLDIYTVEQDYFWMMGDNRDDSADSRYWGFVPHSLMLGEAVFVYMSWDFKRETPRFHRIGTVIS